MNSDNHTEPVRLSLKRNSTASNLLEGRCSHFSSPSEENAFDSDDVAVGTVKRMGNDGEGGFLKHHEYSMPATASLSSDVAIVKWFISEAASMVSTRVEAGEKEFLQEISVRGNWRKEICSIVQVPQNLRAFCENKSKLVMSHCQDVIVFHFVILDKLMGDDVQRKI